MIWYKSEGLKGRLKLITNRHGSVLPRICPFAFATSMFALGLYWYRETLQGMFSHPYAHQVFAISVGFVLVFRGNLSYQRFWEGRTQLQNMS